MSTSVAAFAVPATPRHAGEDPLREAMENLARALPERTDAAVLVDLLEDDLREGLDAMGDLECHFADVIDALRVEKPAPFTLLAVSDEQLVLQRLDALVSVLTQVRRRLSQAAGMLRRG
ncbi:hypothetical protein [Hyalangium rubrum]|uniref:Uncharacterized protein n=1 Tax=Hyalangium rubrum TaxID=3103134 RepID=A0ABU5GVP3_9BACT|nr:hypothetical protein [Hyalangium sp. s54d21]MDY7225244.1 hypothetical protein [Hyalangium sp. s54d21]